MAPNGDNTAKKLEGWEMGPEEDGAGLNSFAEPETEWFTYRAPAGANHTANDTETFARARRGKRFEERPNYSLDAGIALDDQRVASLRSSRLQRGRRPKNELDILSRLEYMNVFQLIGTGVFAAMVIAVVSIAFFMWIDTLI